MAELIDAALRAGYAVARVPPAADVFAFLTAAASHGPSLLLFPSIVDASEAATRLGATGLPVALYPRDWAMARAGGVTVVGTRAAAWAPAPGLASVVVVDGHDESYQQEAAPTWHARIVAAERARRAAVPCVVVSACPDLATIGSSEPLALSRGAERSGWPIIDVVDRRADDPRTGLFSEQLASAIRRHDRVVCVLNRKGRARLLACAACGELVRCEHCGAPMATATDGGLACTACGRGRPAVCAACGAGRLKALRLGVTRVREELAGLTGREVAEVTGDTDRLPDAPVIVGTEAVLHRVRTADLVAFLDFDQELLAARYRANEQALALLARAGRIVGGRKAGRRVLLQTRLPDHEVIDAAVHGDPSRLAASERVRREALGFPPFSALALISGPSAPELAQRLGQLDTVELIGPDNDRWLVRAPNSRVLADAFATAGRPPGRLRIEVDPLRI
jgi:primosomal protein N' (replication factor Y)